MVMGAPRSMTMAMVDVRIVRMAVPKRRMLVGMGMRFDTVPVEVMLVAVVLAVAVPMSVRQRRWARWTRRCWQAARRAGVCRRITAAAIGAITGSVIVIAKRSLIDIPTVLIALATVALLWKFKKTTRAGRCRRRGHSGLVIHPLVH